MLGRTYCSLITVLLITATEAFQSWAPPITDADADACSSLDRRQLISQALFTAGQLGGVLSASALVDLTQPTSESDRYDDDRNKIMDSLFSRSMAT